MAMCSCPKCGDINIAVDVFVSSMDQNADGWSGASAMCLNCRYEVKATGNSKKESRENVISEWNKGSVLMMFRIDEIRIFMQALSILYKEERDNLNKSMIMAIKMRMRLEKIIDRLEK